MLSDRKTDKQILKNNYKNQQSQFLNFQENLFNGVNKSLCQDGYPLEYFLTFLHIYNIVL